MLKEVPSQGFKRRSFIGAAMAAFAAASVARASPGSMLALDEAYPRLRSTIDITDPLQDAIMEAKRKGLGGVLIPSGEFKCRSLTLPSKVRLLGAGKGATRLRTIASDENAFITIEEGPIIRSGIEHITLVGGTPETATNPRQWALEITARPKEGEKITHGGWWWSKLDTVDIVSFGHGINLAGDTSSKFLLPHQFLSFRDMAILLSQDAAGPAVRMTGEDNQFVFQQCVFDRSGGMGPEGSTLVEIGDPGLLSLGGAGPILLLFQMCTFQHADQAVAIRGSQNITFDTCWFEQLNSSILATERALGIHIRSSRFANAAKLRPAIEFSASTAGSIQTNMFVGAETAVPYKIDEDADVDVLGNISTLGAGAVAE